MSLQSSYQEADACSPVNETESTNDSPPPKVYRRCAATCCGWYEFQGVTVAKGYCALGAARGALIMSNIFLSTAFMYLASEQAGCLNDEKKIVDNCDSSVYGMNPAALITNIAVISGLLSAFFMPVTGAMVDYTPYRHKIGIAVATMMMMIQAAQIAILPGTWFVMAILQGIAGFLYQAQVLTTYAYLPDIARVVGEATMTHFNSTFVIVQFSSQASFLLVVIALGIAFDLSDVQTGQVSQAINTFWSGAFFAIGWKILPSAPASRNLPPGNKTLVGEGFLQVWRTSKHMHKEYGNSLQWFFLAVVFAEAAANAFTVVSVVFLDEQLGMSATEIGIFFFVTLLGTLPGSTIGAVITSRTNPSISWKLSMTTLSITSIVGAFTLKQDANAVAYVWGFFIGLELGWFYPTENLMFSMLLPKGQEAELSGFFVYCTQILGWLPPLIFSVIVEQNIHQKYGILLVQAFFAFAILCLFYLRWEKALEEVHGSASKPQSEGRNRSQEELTKGKIDKSLDLESASVVL